ncbi:MAG: hypothetical protein ACRD1Z_02455, partial [Vicinamibacteria bacterium]
MTAKLAYSEEELLREHEFAALHVVAERRLHGGFDSKGRYVSPRQLVRPKAIRAWQDVLARRGISLLDCPVSLFPPNYPSFEQAKLLLQNGIGQILWNGISIAGEVEGRGSLLVGVPPPG